MTPTEQAADRVKALVEKLREMVRTDHLRGCEGREYECSCGHIDRQDQLMDQAADALTALQARAEDAERRVEEMEQADSRWVIRFSEVREASGIGYAPMLSEVPAAIRAKLGGYEFLLALMAAAAEERTRILSEVWEGYGHWKRLAEDRATSANNLLTRARFAEARAEELEGALKPFADQFGELARPDDWQVFGNLVLGDFRRATDLLTPPLEQE